MEWICLPLFFQTSDDDDAKNSIKMQQMVIAVSIAEPLEPASGGPNPEL